MTPRPRFRLLLAVAALVAVFPHAPARAATAVVTYLSGATVYLGSGDRDGILEGAKLAAEASASAVVLQAFEVTPRHAACRVLEGAVAAVRVGDRFRFEPVARAAPAVAGGAVVPGKAWGGHGRLGVRYLLTRDGLNDRTDFQQPALDALVDAPALFGTSWGLRIDVRARRTIQSGPDVDRTRVYSLLGGWDPSGPGWRFALGRQVSPDLANVSVFDGALGAYDAGRWSAGGFAGTEPSDEYRLSSAVREYGAFGAWHAKPETPHRWAVSTGAVASYEASEVNREYLFVHGRYTGPRIGAFFTQELDVNRGWKRDAGETVVEPTSTFASVRIRATDRVDVFTGMDSRRNVRLYRDFISPETEFDDAFRRGYWLGADTRVGPHLRFGLNGRTSRGGSAGAANSLTASASADRITSLDLSTRLRATRWTNDRSDGWLYAANLGGDVADRFRLGLEVGRRTEDSALNSNLSDGISWFGLTFDADLARRLFATASLDRSHGSFEDVTQLYATLAYRF